MQMTTSGGRRNARRLAGLATVAAAVFLLLTRGDPGHSRRFFGLWSTVPFLGALVLLGVAGLAVAASRSKQALFGALTVAVSCGLVLFAFEAAGLVGLVDYPALFKPPVDEPLGELPAANIDVRGETRQDTAGVWNLSDEPIPFHYQTNRLGFRNLLDRETADVYLVGDSIVVAALLPFVDTMGPQLEKALGRPVMNVALINKSPRGCAEGFWFNEIDPKGKLVLQVLFEGNDLMDTDADKVAGETGGVDRTPLKERLLTHHLLLWLQRITQPVPGIARHRTGTIGDQLYTFFWTREHFAGFEPYIETITKELVEMNDKVEAGGGEFGVIYFPAKLRVLGPLVTWPEGSELGGDWEAHINDPFREAMQTFAKETEVPVLDVTAPLQAVAKTGDIPWFWGDTHPNATAHRVTAKAIAEWPMVQAFLTRTATAAEAAE